MGNFFQARLRFLTQEQPLRQLRKWLHLLEVKAQLYRFLRQRAVLSMMYIVFTIQITYRVVQFSSVPQLCPTLCDPVDCGTPGLPVYHQLPEIVYHQTHVR